MADFRKPTPWEAMLLRHLLSAPFSGRDELLEQLQGATVRSIDEDGSVEIQAPDGPAAPVDQRVPVQAMGKDVDGVPIYVLLHVVGGRACELELYKADGNPIGRRPQPTEMEILVLPPPPDL